MRSELEALIEEARLIETFFESKDVRAFARATGNMLRELQKRLDAVEQPQPCPFCAITLLPKSQK